MKRILLFFFIMAPVLCLFSNKQGLSMSEVSVVRINKYELDKLNKTEYNGVIKYGGFIYLSCEEDIKKLTLILAMMKAESNFNKKAISKAGAMGLMQLMPNTALEESFKMGRNIKLNDLIRNPQINIDIGISYFLRVGEQLSDIKDNQKRIKLMIASYNAGPYGVRRVFGCKSFSCYSKVVNELSDDEFGKKLSDHLPSETITYLKSVENHYNRYKNIFETV